MYFCMIIIHLRRVVIVFLYISKELWFESQLILNDFDCAAIARVDQFCEPSVLRLGKRERERGRGSGREGEGEGWGESYSLSTMNRLS